LTTDGTKAFVIFNYVKLEFAGSSNRSTGLGNSAQVNVDIIITCIIIFQFNLYNQQNLNNEYSTILHYHITIFSKIHASLSMCA